jgi:hypothetical protein
MSDKEIIMKLAYHFAGGLLFFALMYLIAAILYGVAG